MENSRILIVEDDATLLRVLEYNLANEGYQVITAIDGARALDLAKNQNPDLILLDVMLPEIDGIEVCHRLRRIMSVPIIMLTAKSEEEDKVMGLEAGADDYVTKPFGMKELLARVKAMLRRAIKLDERPTRERESSALHVGGIEIDRARHEVKVRDTIIELGPKEFDLLSLLMENAGQVLTRNQILEKIWGYEYEGDTRTVDVHVRWLRQKLESDPANPNYIITVRNIGYKFKE